MIISHRNNFVFVSTPKVGTHSFYDLLIGEYEGQLYDYNQRLTPFDKNVILHPTRIPEFARNYYKFTVVRNPYERAVSAWWDIMKPHKGDKYEKLIGGRSFQHYTDAVKSYPTILGRFKEQNGSNNPFVKRERLMAQFTSQSKWHEENEYDDILYIENIKLDQLPFAKPEITLPKVYALSGERKPWQDYYTEKDYTNIQQAWKEDFENYGYDI